jgi:hypothetical protein
MLKDGASLSTSVADMRNTITIDDEQVVMVAQPKTTFKLMRVINHWIDNLIQHSPNPEEINTSSAWYIKWKAIYPYIRASKRKYIEIYHITTNDYGANEETGNVANLIKHFVDTIPHFRSHYDINPVKHQPEDNNYFEFTLRLFYCGFTDDANKFSALETTSFLPFTSNRSVTTWRTSQSQTSSVMGQSLNLKIPEEINTIEEMGNLTIHDNIVDSKGISNDTDLSLSPNPLSTSDMNPKKDRKHRNANKTEDLKQLVSNTCKNEIKNEMGNIRNEIGTFQNTMKTNFDTQNKEIVRIIGTLSNPHVKSSIATDTDIPPLEVPSMYRTSMPSPTHAKATKPFNYKTNSEGPAPVSDTAATTSLHKDKPFQRSGTLIFTYNGETYELRDGDFNKHSAKLITVNNGTELVHYYKQLQSMSVTYNIFLQQFNNLLPWHKSPNTIPTTCIFPMVDTESNTVDAYRRMKSALFNKINGSTFTNAEHKAIIKHGSIHQDGFETLYDLMTHCHPKLVTMTTKYRKINHKPTFDRDDSIYSYAEKLQVWLDLEGINGHEFTDDEILNIIMDQLRADTRYDTAVAGINSELYIRDTFQRSYGKSVFPDSLKLQNIPGTVMSYYTAEDKKALFPTDNSTSGTIHLMHSIEDAGTAIVNSFHGKPSFSRESVDKMCPGCGKYGHSVFHNGCDFCANFLLASEFFKKYPKIEGKVLDKYKEHQEKRQKARNRKPMDKGNNNNYQKKKKPFNPRSKAKVRMLTDMLSDVLEDSNESSCDEDYEDANETSVMESDTEQTEEE